MRVRTTAGSWKMSGRQLCPQERWECISLLAWRKWRRGARHGKRPPTPHLVALQHFLPHHIGTAAPVTLHCSRPSLRCATDAPSATELPCLTPLSPRKISVPGSQSCERSAMEEAGSYRSSHNSQTSGGHIPHGGSCSEVCLISTRQSGLACRKYGTGRCGCKASEPVCAVIKSV